MRTSTRELFRQWFVVAFALLFQVGVTVRAHETQAAGRGTQGQSSILKGPYLGQKWAGPGSELFAPHIVSTGLLESSIAFAPDGRACYFSVTLPPALSVIAEMKQENGNWSAPEVATFSQGPDDGNPTISPDGRHFYFTSTRSLDGGPKPSSRWGACVFGILPAPGDSGSGWGDFTAACRLSGKEADRRGNREGEGWIPAQKLFVGSIDEKNIFD
jgi:hypothetical protein